MRASPSNQARHSAGGAQYIPGKGYDYQNIKCFYAECRENAPHQLLVDGAPRQLCEHHFVEAEREKRWIARGKPTAEESIKRMYAMLRTPKMTMLERAHMILAQDSPDLGAKEWADAIVKRNKRGEALPGDASSTFKHISEYLPAALDNLTKGKP